MHFKIIILFFLINTLINTKAKAWGGRAHHSICSAAASLVQNKELKEFLQLRPHIMGHLCNTPDVFWKSIKDTHQDGNPSHYIDLEIVGLKIMEIPESYQDLQKTYTNKPNHFKKDSVIKNFHKEFGSVWWRTDQFMRLIAGLKDDFAKAETPKKPEDYQNFDLLYNKSVYNMMVYMGLMGHFVGDAAQSYHNTADYDGFAIGHGGIHEYYETTTIGFYEPDLESLIYKSAVKLPNNKTGNTFTKMKKLSELAFNEIPQLIKLDPVLSPSLDKKPAERKSPEIGLKKFKAMQIKQMARSARLLADLWDEAYMSAGSPPLKEYKSYKYPYAAEYIAPDYLIKE